MKLKHGIFIFILFFAMAVQIPLARAGGSHAGNGGDGILIGTTLNLLDFFENGVQDNPDFGNGDKYRDIHEKAKQLLMQRTSQLSGLSYDLLFQKLGHVFAYDKELGNNLATGVVNLQWRLVDGELINIPDENTVIEDPRGKIVQIAVRNDDVVRISRSYWNQLNERHKVGLVFHEAISFILSIMESETKGTKDVMGYLFTSDLRRHEKKRQIIGKAYEHLFWSHIKLEKRQSLLKAAHYSYIFQYEIPWGGGTLEIDVDHARTVLNEAMDRLEKVLAEKDSLHYVPARNEIEYQIGKLEQYGVTDGLFSSDQVQRFSALKKQLSDWYSNPN